MTREEAIEVYNGLINTKIKEAFEFFAPELAGSEDERVRKEIISIVKAYRENCIDEGTHRFDDCLSWLEKQKEPEQPVEGLEEELEKMWLEWCEDVDYLVYASIARHFAEWDRAKILVWAKERYQQTFSNTGCYTGHSVWAEVIEKLESL